MDIARPEIARKRFKTRLFLAGATLSLLGGVTVGLGKLNPAAPVLDSSSVYLDSVKRGDMVREIRGSGTLLPQEIKWIPASTAGRVERILTAPGTAVGADTVIVELSNPEVEHSVFEAEWQVKAAEAQLAKLRAQLNSERLTQKAQTAQIRTEYAVASLDAEADSQLLEEKLIDRLSAARSKAKAEQLAIRVDLEAQRLETFEETARAQLAAEEAELERLRAVLRLRCAQKEKLKVRSGIAGVLQRLGEPDSLQLGQQVPAGATLARVANASNLKAEIKVPATQAKDVVPGQQAQVDTRTGKISGRVARVDPSVVNGTVTVEIALEGPLPRGARPDLSVEAVIELERLDNVLFVGRPVQAQADGSLSVFRLKSGRHEAERVVASFGRTSVHTIEVLSGLKPGDTILLNDMSSYDGYNRVRVK